MWIGAGVMESRGGGGRCCGFVSLPSWLSPPYLSLMQGPIILCGGRLSEILDPKPYKMMCLLIHFFFPEGQSKALKDKGLPFPSSPPLLFFFFFEMEFFSCCPGWSALMPS